jgi:hypothetical protein
MLLSIGVLVGGGGEVHVGWLDTVPVIVVVCPGAGVPPS